MVAGLDADGALRGRRTAAGPARRPGAAATDDRPATHRRLLAQLRLAPARPPRRRPAPGHPRLPARLPAAPGAAAGRGVLRRRAGAARGAARGAPTGRSRRWASCGSRTRTRARTTRSSRAFATCSCAASTLEDAYLALALGAARPASRPCSSSTWRTRSCAASSTAAATACGCAPPSACSARRTSPSRTVPILLADADTVVAPRPHRRPRQPRPAPGRGPGPASAPVELDVLGEANAAAYLARSDRFDTVLDVSFTRPGPGRAVPRARGLGPALPRDRGRRSSHCSRSATSAGAGMSGSTPRRRRCSNALYAGEEVGEDRQARLLSLFRLELKDPELRPPGRARPAGLSGHGAERRARAAG